jgi:putative transcriptional regulator
MDKILTWLMFAAWLLPASAGADQPVEKGKLLVATELVGGDFFAQTVVLLLHYDETGAMGLVVNRPTEIEPDELLADLEAMSGYSGPIYWGGPVQMNSVRALLRTDKPPEGALEIIDSIYQLPVDDALPDVSVDSASLHLFIGYAGWSAGQLDHELARGSWHILPAAEDIIFAEDPGALWKRLMPAPEFRAAVK